MQRTTLLFAYFFACANSIAQQFPFVHYTPKDGLISNVIKNIYQDSKGRLYFASVHGLSIYDGSRFINYNSKNGLNFDIVNCVMEMGDDSVWIVTNSTKMNCLVKGKMKLLPFHDDDYIINNLCKDVNGNIYAAAEEGLLIFDNKDRFMKLPFADLRGGDASSYMANVFSVGDYLLAQRDDAMLPNADYLLYLYNKTTKKVTAEIPGIYGVHAAPDGRIWVNTEQKLLSLDTTELRKGKLVLQDLPGQFAQLRSKRRHFVLFDKGNNCWLGDQNSVLIRAGPDGTMTTFTSVSGLNMFSINFILQDSEGTTWIATQNAGVSKLVHSNFSHLEKPFDIIHPSDISYNENKNHLLIYSSSTSAATVVNDREKKYLDINNLNNITSLVETPSGFLATRLNGIYKLIQKKNALYAETRPILSDAPDNVYSGSAIDHNGNFIVCGKYHVSAIVKGEIIFRKKLPFFADFPVVDARGNIWVATRSNDLFMYQTHPDQPANYLEQKKHFKNELSGISPRSITIDKNNNIWIGTRNNGIQVFYVSDGNLIRKFSLTAATGLSDDFITYLTCDPENNIWACSGLGLDKIRIKNEIPVIENITKQNHIYQSVFKVAVDKNNTVWGLASNGLIRITPEERQVYDYRPTLIVSLVKAGKDTIRNDNSFSHKQNNLSFYFSATSFLDEKQILYSYRLQGGSNDQWSEPSNNSTVSFIDLPPGNYTLDIKAGFPAGRYPEQIISYKFLISPAWWQTWWFRLVNALVLIALLIITFRYYYRRKLEKQKIFLEKQQAIEKERTRIATDMHDDLGAGLSRIKFLSQSLLNKKKDEIMKPELEKITSFSDEMSEKMGEIIWALNEKNDTLADLIAYTRSYAAEYLASHDIQCQANTPMNLPGTFITGEMRRNIFLSVKECLHNVVKHAGATKVCFSIDLNHHMQIIIHDNGKGIDPDSQRLFSNGIQNIEKRMKEIDGKVSFTNDEGTKVSLTIPITL